jgi:hypothetical protein
MNFTKAKKVLGPFVHYGFPALFLLFFLYAIHSGSEKNPPIDFKNIYERIYLYSWLVFIYMFVVFSWMTWKRSLFVLTGFIATYFIFRVIYA